MKCKPVSSKIIPAVFILLALALFPVQAKIVEKKDKDKQEIKKIVVSKSPVKADWIGINISRNWAFVDVAEKYPSGKGWKQSTCMLLRKIDNKWKLLVQGDPLDEPWENYVKQMPPDVQKAHAEWMRGHL